MTSTKDDKINRTTRPIIIGLIVIAVALTIIFSYNTTLYLMGIPFAEYLMLGMGILLVFLGVFEIVATKIEKKKGKK